MSPGAIKDKSGRNLGTRAMKTRQRFLDATEKLLAERTRLMEKNELAKSKVEAMIMRLKALESD